MSCYYPCFTLSTTQEFSDSLTHSHTLFLNFCLEIEECPHGCKLLLRPSIAHFQWSVAQEGDWVQDNKWNLLVAHEGRRGEVSTLGSGAWNEMLWLWSIGLVKKGRRGLVLRLDWMGEHKHSVRSAPLCSSSTPVLQKPGLSNIHLSSWNKFDDLFSSPLGEQRTPEIQCPLREVANIHCNFKWSVWYFPVPMTLPTVDASPPLPCHPPLTSHSFE